MEFTRHEILIRKGKQRQRVFPASGICRDARYGAPQRFHIHESVLQKAIHAAARKARIAKPVGPHIPLISE
jgi:hypothetical protein